MSFIRFMFGDPYDPMDLSSIPPDRKPVHDFTGTHEARQLLGFALRGAPIDEPELDLRRCDAITGRDRR